jgi:hypothetical protein
LRNLIMIGELTTRKELSSNSLWILERLQYKVSIDKYRYI